MELQPLSGAAHEHTDGDTNTDTDAMIAPLVLVGNLARRIPAQTYRHLRDLVVALTAFIFVWMKLWHSH